MPDEKEKIDSSVLPLVRVIDNHLNLLRRESEEELKYRREKKREWDKKKREKK